MKKYSLIIVLALSLFLISCNSSESVEKSSQVKEIKVFHAGSLAVPFDEIESAFEQKYPEFDVKRQAAGSRDTVRKVTDLNKKADIVASADYTVIDELMIPKFSDWYVNFVTNEMVIMYNSDSKRADEINKNNWYKILLDESVEYGHSEPDSDPCGYRSQLVWKLAQNYYKEDNLYNKLVENIPNKNIRPKETDLLALLETGELDYLFIYKSVAKQHGHPFLELPDQINLKTNKYSDIYKKVSFDVSGKKPGKKIKKIGQPMVYGVTIPKNSSNKEGAIEFMKFLLGKEGKKIMNKNGQPSVDPLETNDYKKLPKELKKLF